MKQEYVTHSPEETEKIAEELATRFTTGGVIALEGNLGVGKTVFVKGLARGLGITSVIQSPTFVIMKVYPVAHRGLKNLVHVDCYRLDSADQIRATGLEDYLRDRQSLVVIEWADKIRELVPSTAQWISFDSLSFHDRRIIISSNRADGRHHADTER